MKLNASGLILIALSTTLARAEDRGRERPVSGTSNPALASLDDMMSTFIRKHKVPGAALAVARNGRLIYARGFGLADREAGEPVQPDALFRIASISKPITAVAILKLVERGSLSLDDRVFDRLALAAKVPPKATLDPRWRRVTIRHLLQHTGGWDREVSFDPMFRSVEFARQAGVEPPAGPEQVIRAMLGVPLDFDPGARFAYSNFGYCLLGRVIERVSGRDYGSFVRDDVLGPQGIRSMRLGRTRLEDRAPNEVHYYVPGHSTGPSVFAADLGRDVPQPYGAWNLEALDSHGGWIASAIDLVRFASALDDDTNPRLLRPEMIHVLFERPEGNPGFKPDHTPRDRYYACGWRVVRFDDGRHFNAWHTGSLPGTSTLLVRRHDGFCWAVLFNTRAETDLSFAIDGLMHEAVDRLPAWPESTFRRADRVRDPLSDLPEFQTLLLDLAFPSVPFAR